MKTLTIIFSILFAIRVSAQIPNDGFENWRNVGVATEPTNWYSFYSLIDSASNYCPVTRSTDHYPLDVGNYSVRIANDTAIWNSGIIPDSFLGWGMLTSAELNDKPLFPVSGHPGAFFGYYKFFPENGDTMNIYIHLYKNGIEITGGRFQYNILTPNWTIFQIIFNDTSYNSVDSARISFSAANEPKDGSWGPLGNSVLYIDNISFDSLITPVTKLTDENPDSFFLNQNYPNPFNPSTVICYQLPVSRQVRLIVFNVLGDEVAKLVNEYKQAGKYETEFNAEALASGVYFYQLKAGSYVNTKKMLLLK